jgi:hypothetical protein
MPKDVTINVYLDNVNTDPPAFRVLPANSDLPTRSQGNPPGQPEIVFSNAMGQDGFKITFQLQGDTQGYFFPTDSEKDKAVWSKCGNVCPTNKGVWEVFEPQSVEEPNPLPPNYERRKLVVLNKNPDMGNHKGQGKFKYNLRLYKPSAPPNARWLNLDPGGDNTNGSSRSSYDYLSVATVGVITGILSALVTTFALAKFNLVCPAPPGF